MRRYRPVITPLLMCLLLPAADDDLARLSAAVRGLAAERVAVAADQRLTTGDGCLRLVLAGALPAREGDLVVEIVFRGGAIHAARGRAPGFSPLLFAVDTSGFQAAPGGGALAGELVVAVAHWTDKRREDLLRGVPQPGRWAVSGDRRKMTATLINPTTAPYPTGPCAVTQRWIPVAVPTFAEVPQPDLLSVLAMVDTQAAQAQSIYADLRALELQARTGLPFTIARRDVGDTRWDYLPRRTGSSASGDDDDSAPDAGPADKNDSAATKPPPSKQPPAKRPTEREPPRKKADDILDLGLDAVVDPPETPRAAALAADHAEALLATVQAWRSSDLHMAVVQDADACPDPGFQPCGSAPLPVGKDGVAQLPAATPATPEWVHLDIWRFLGPFPLPTWDTASPNLPDLLPLRGVNLVVDPAAVQTPHAEGPFSGPNPRPWLDVRSHPTDATLIPPVAMTFGKYPTAGMDWAGFYAATELDSPQEQTVWAAVTSGSRIGIWVNDRHVFSGGWIDGDATREVHLRCLPVRLAQGRNRLLLRCDHGQRPHWCRFQLCLGGTPRSAEVAAQEDVARRSAVAAAGPALAGVQAFRGNHQGTWPEAGEVPAAWSLATGDNVRWKTALGDANAAVTLLGSDRLLTCEEPFTLVCIDRRDGRVLWRHTADPLELLDPAAHAQAQPLWVQHAAGDAQATSALGTLYQRSLGHGITSSWAGNAMSTPIVSGERIWWKVGSRALACLDRDGRRQWFVPAGGSGGGMCHPISSPILVDGLVIMQIPTYGKDPEEEAMEPAWEDVRGLADRHRQRRQVLRAWSATDGTRRWTSRQFIQPHFGNRYDADGAATPHPLRLVTPRGDTVTILVTTSGAVFRADDGVQLLANCGTSGKTATPCDDGSGTVWIFESEYGGHSGAYGRMMANEFIAKDRDHLGVRTRWSRLLQGEFLAGAARGDNHLHMLEGGASGQLWTLDRHTGAITHLREDLFAFQIGNPYMPPAIAAGRLYLAEDGRNRYNRDTAWADSQKPTEQRRPMHPSAGMVVCTTGAAPTVLARNRGLVNDGPTMAPAFADGAMYLRTRVGLFCITHTGAEGRRYETERVAATVLAELPLMPWDPAEPQVGQPLTELPYSFRPEALPVGRLLSGWWVSAPASPDAAAALGFPDCPKLAGNSSTVAGLAVRVWERKKDYDPPHEHMARDWSLGLSFDLVRIHDHQPGSVCCWATIVSVDRERVLRLEQPLSGVALSIGGVLLSHGQRIRLTRGNYRICVHSTLPADPGPELRWTPRFWPADTAAEEVAMRRATVERVRPWLERAVAELPGSPLAAQAAAALAGP